MGTSKDFMHICGRKKCIAFTTFLFFFFLNPVFSLFLENIMQTPGLSKQKQHIKYWSWFSALPLTRGKVDASCAIASPLKFTFSSLELRRRRDAFPYFTGGSAVTWKTHTRTHSLKLKGYSQLHSAKLFMPLKDMWDYQVKIRLVTRAVQPVSPNRACCAKRESRKLREETVLTK